MYMRQEIFWYTWRHILTKKNLWPIVNRPIPKAKLDITKFSIQCEGFKNHPKIFSVIFLTYNIHQFRAVNDTLRSTLARKPILFNSKNTISTISELLARLNVKLINCVLNSKTTSCKVMPQLAPGFISRFDISHRKILFYFKETILESVNLPLLPVTNNCRFS
jgi:hypothetical protein